MVITIMSVVTTMFFSVIILSGMVLVSLAVYIPLERVLIFFNAGNSMLKITAPYFVPRICPKWDKKDKKYGCKTEGEKLFMFHG
jgi:hypothetical protein